MTRAASAPFAACLALAGCLSDDWAGGKVVNGVRSKVVDTSKTPPPALPVAKRVDELGLRITGQNPFTGIDPLFTTVGDAKPVAFHRGVSQVFVSDGLVKRCPADADLAAVLCSELGKMMAEQRHARAAGVELKSLPEPPGVEPSAGPKPAVPAGPQETDPDVLARDLMRGAGFDPAVLESVAPLLKEAAANAATFERAMAGPSAAPRWNP